MNEDLIWHVHDYIFPATFALLPGQMDSLKAKAELLTISMQESDGLKHRHQVGGPAHGLWQFEQGGGVAGVLSHPSTHGIILPICDMLLYKPTSLACYTAIEHNDVLAACFARLLLWTDPRSLPAHDEADKGWSIYLSQWRPGKPHRQTWDAYFQTAWNIVGG